MAKELILAKYGEMALKGLNRGTFEDILMKNLRRRLKKFGAFKLNRAQSTIYMEPLSEDIDLDEVLEHLQCVFGIAALCLCLRKDHGGHFRQGGALSGRSSAGSKDI